MAGQDGREYVETLVIGGGQAGLATGYQLSQRDLPFKIIDANRRIGDAWRNRWDSLRLFTPNRFNHLPGMPFPGYHWGFPSKNEMADYLESYARKFDLRVETGVRVERLTREGDRFVATSGDRRFEADNVVVAMSSWQRPRVPDYAPELDPRIVQLHVAEYKNPGQIQEGDVLVVGAGNSGAEVAIELARTHNVSLSGAGNGAIPFRPESVAARVLMPFVGRVIFHRVLTTMTPIGKKARP
jgi:putative flavoprotein involved in K+ transport